MTLDVILAPWNLLYIVPFMLALVYLGLFVFTGISFGDADADVDVDADVDADIDADVDHDLQVEAHVVDSDVDADADADVDADGDTNGAALAHAHAHAIMPHAPHHAGTHHAAATDSPFLSFLTLLGIGKIPVSLVLMVLCFAWGIVGFALNALLMQWIGNNFLVGIISLPMTIVIAFTLTGLCASLVAKILPTDENRRERRQDLVGKSGQAIYDINGDFGMASVRGNAGDLFQVPCRTPPGKPVIAKGTRIVLFDYDPENQLFHVAPFDA